ncbi:HAT2 [Symbiodinium sp. CCMP2456]|nr:HAT2 [Symbiodinium sp. CCMP2456]
MAMITSVEKLQLLGSSAITRRYLQLRFGLICGEDGGGQGEEASNPLKRKQECGLGLPDLPTRKKLWQAQVPHLYDLVVTHRRSPDIRSFSWPSGAARISKNAVLQRIVLGSSKALMLAAVRLPWPERLAEESDRPWEEPAGEEVQPFVRITQYMACDGLSTLACSPHEYLLTATQNTSGEVLVFRAADWEVAYQDECRPELRLSGEGGPAGLAWTESSSQLLAANRGGVTGWNIHTGSATARFAAGREVTALAASSFGNTFIVGCSGGRLAWWDTRVQGLAPTGSCDTGHGPVQCAAFADVELGSNQLATGSADGHLQTWDVRQLSAPLCDLSWPGSACGGVTHVAWAPSGNRMQAAAYGDGRVVLWDPTQRAETAQPVSESQPGQPPDAKFVHGAHSGQDVCGVAWSRDCPWLLASAVREDLQFWRPSAALFAAPQALGA